MHINLYVDDAGRETSAPPAQPQVFFMVICNFSKEFMQMFCIYVMHSQSVDGRAEPAILAVFGEARWFEL